MTAKAKTKPKPKAKTKAKTKPPVDKAWHDKKKETEGTTRAYYVSIGVTFLIPAKTKAELQKKLVTIKPAFLKKVNSLPGIVAEKNLFVDVVFPVETENK